jgi:hypothetical protein
MSKPTIWDIAMGGKPPEKFVPYEEYKKLETENARLKTEVEGLTEAWVDKKMQEDRDALLQQVERLTKAGDAMAEELVRLEAAFNGIESAEAQIWYIAKEGGCP